MPNNTMHKAECGRVEKTAPFFLVFLTPTPGSSVRLFFRKISWSTNILPNINALPDHVLQSFLNKTSVVGQIYIHTLVPRNICAPTPVQCDVFAAPRHPLSQIMALGPYYLDRMRKIRKSCTNDPRPLALCKAHIAIAT